MSSFNKSDRGLRAILLSLLVLTALAGPAALAGAEPAGATSTDDSAHIDPNG